MLSLFLVLLHPLLADGVLDRGRDYGGVVKQGEESTPSVESKAGTEGRPIL